jgi:hypothetical protein
MMIYPVPIFMSEVENNKKRIGSFLIKGNLCINFQPQAGLLNVSKKYTGGGIWNQMCTVNFFSLQF